MHIDQRHKQRQRRRRPQKSSRQKTQQTNFHQITIHRLANVTQDVQQAVTQFLLVEHWFDVLVRGCHAILEVKLFGQTHEQDDTKDAPQHRSNAGHDEATQTEHVVGDAAATTTVTNAATTTTTTTTASVVGAHWVKELT